MGHGQLESIGWPWVYFLSFGSIHVNIKCHIHRWQHEKLFAIYFLTKLLSIVTRHHLFVLETHCYFFNSTQKHRTCNIKIVLNAVEMIHLSICLADVTWCHYLWIKYSQLTVVIYLWWSVFFEFLKQFIVFVCTNDI